MEKYELLNNGKVFVVLLLVLFVSVSVADNEVVTTQVTISDADPTALTIVECKFAGATQPTEYTPTTATDYRVNCTVTVTDPNGFSDIDVVWAYWYKTGTAGAPICASDTDDCYVETACSVISGTGSGTSQSYHCDIPIVEYFADTGTWNMTAYANDTNGGTSTSNTTQRTINSLKSVNCSATLNFGSQAPGVASTVATDLYVENQGNNDFTVTVQGNGDMSCTTGTVAVGKIKYDLTDNTAYATADGILSVSDTWTDGTCTVLDQESTHSSFEYTTGTYWGINVTEGTAGTCNNTITFTAN